MSTHASLASCCQHLAEDFLWLSECTPLRQQARCARELAYPPPETGEHPPSPRPSQVGSLEKAPQQQLPEPGHGIRLWVPTVLMCSMMCLVLATCPSLSLGHFAASLQVFPENPSQVKNLALESRALGPLQRELKPGYQWTAISWEKLICCRLELRMQFCVCPHGLLH